MRDGNGYAPLGSLRWLRTIWRPPARTFTGDDIARALTAEGWEITTGPPHDWHVYSHPQKPDRLVTFNASGNFTDGDAMFQIVAQRMGITHKRLRWLLWGH